MISRTFGRTILAAVIVGIVLVPAAAADSWARDQHVALDPAIATALQDRATVEHPSLALDPAIATALRDRATVAPQGVTLDPAIRTALLDRASAPTRPDDRPGTHGVGSLPAEEQVAASDSFDWNVVGIGAGATFAALLLGLGSLLALRHGRARVTNA